MTQPTQQPPVAESDAPASTEPTSYARLALGGAAWTVATTVASKLISFGSQLALGWWLAKGDFAVYAVAISAATLVAALYDGGAQRILVQRGKEYAQLAAPVFRLSLMFNLLAAALLALAAPVIAHFREMPELRWVMWIMALSIPLGTPAMILRSRLNIDLRFGALAKITTGVTVLRHGLMVMFAFFGLGAMSFVLPLLIVPPAEALALYLAGGAAQWRRVRLTWPLFRSLFADARWIMLGSLASGLVLNGDYVVLSIMAREETLALYFFGFQLIWTIAVLFGSGTHSILIPVLSRLSDEPARQIDGYIRTLRLVAGAGAPLCVFAALASYPAIHALWAGKWNDAAFVAQVMALALLPRLLAPIGMSLLAARGRWFVHSAIHWADAVGIMAGAAVGAWAGGLVAITLSVGIYRAVFGLLQPFLIARLLGVPPQRLYGGFLPPIILGLGLGGACFIAGRLLFDGPLLQYLAASALFAVAYPLTALSTIRQMRQELALMRPAPAQSPVA